MSQFISVQLAFDGVTPIAVGRKHLTLQQLIRLLQGVESGKTFRNTVGLPRVAVQSSMVQASATATCAAVAAADTVSIGGTALTATQKRASGTITFSTAIAGNTATINGVVFTAVNGAVTAGQATFDISGGNTTGAASLVTQLAAYADPRLTGVVSAKSTAAVVTVFAVNEGTAGNSYTLASSGATLAVSGAVLANGAAATNNTFDYIGTNAQTAASLAAAINNSTTAAVKVASAAAVNAVVTVTSKVAGLGGNTVTFTSSNGGRLAVTGSGFLASGSEGAATVWQF